MTAARKQKLIQDLHALLDPSFSKNVQLVDEASLSPSLGGSVVVTADNIPSERVLDIVLNNPVRQVCQMESGAIDSELNLSALMLSKPECFFDFPLSSILC